MPEPNEVDDDLPEPGPRRPGAAVIALIVIGMLALAGGATGLTLELTRHATPAEAQAAAAAEVASRWERIPAGQIFPSQLVTLTRQASPLPDPIRDRPGRRVCPGHRSGRGPGADPDGLPERAARQLRRPYRHLVVTVGIAVMPQQYRRDPGRPGLLGQRRHRAGGVQRPRHGGQRVRERPAADVRRSAIRSTGPYLFLATAGFDRRPDPHAWSGRAGAQEPGRSPAPDSLIAIMTKTDIACREKDIQC